MIKGTHGWSLPAAITDASSEDPNRMWPTPSSRDYKGGSGTVKEKDGKYYRQSDTTGTKFGVRLDALVEYQEKQKMWPTPAARDHKDTGENTDYEKLAKKSKLSGAVKSKMFLTPGANEDAAGKPTGKMQRMLGNSPEVRNTGKGTLNPDWVEWLMGYPPGWTDITDLK
tara:strand:- start:54 stop:560 length:507 start_codon:yes stop_codon:yes gene_type:complete